MKCVHGWRSVRDLPRELLRSTVIAEIEEECGHGISVDDSLPDEVISVAMERDLPLSIVRMWIRDRPKFFFLSRDFEAWLDRYGWLPTREPAQIPESTRNGSNA